MYKLVVTLSLLFLTACHHMAQQVMPPVEYQQPVTVHASTNAVLTWHSGEEKGVKNRVPTSSARGVEGMVAAALVQAVMDASEPANTELKYGNAQKVVFMTSLRDTLQNNQVFNNVTLTAESVKPKKGQTHIDIFFKRTEVKDTTASVGTAPSLYVDMIVDMTITDNRGRSFVREYVIEPKHSWKNFFSDTSFKGAQIKSSTILMNSLMQGIEEWQRQK